MVMSRFLLLGSRTGLWGGGIWLGAGLFGFWVGNCWGIVGRSVGAWFGMGVFFGNGYRVGIGWGFAIWVLGGVNWGKERGFTWGLGI